MNRPLRLTECFVGISWVNVDILRSVGWAFRGMFATLLQSVSNVIGRPSAAVGADLSCPHIYIRHAFAICLKHIHRVFATCSLSVCYIFAKQKYGF